MGVSENKGYLLWGPYSKDPTTSGTISGCRGLRELLDLAIGASIALARLDLDFAHLGAKKQFHLAFMPRDAFHVSVNCLPTASGN